MGVQVINAFAMGAASGPWTPSSLGSDVQAWWDPGVGTTFFSGTNTQTWTDKTSNARVMNTVNSGTSLIYSATGLNSLPIMESTATGRRSYATYLHTGTQFMLFAAAFKYINVGNNFGRYFSHGHTTFTNDFSQDTTWQFSRDNNTTTVGANRNGSFGTTAPGYGVWMMLMFVFDGVDCRFYVNDVLTGTPLAKTAAFNTNRLAFFFSADSTIDNDFGCGSIADVITMHRAPTTVERNKFFGWAAHRYALTGLLDAGHPYKTVAPTAELADNVLPFERRLSGFYVPDHRIILPKAA
jgi:hypothetical protein